MMSYARSTLMVHCRTLCLEVLLKPRCNTVKLHSRTSWKKGVQYSLGIRPNRRWFASKAAVASVPVAEINSIRGRSVATKVQTNNGIDSKTKHGTAEADAINTDDKAKNGEDSRTVFHKPSQYLVDINLEPPKSQITLFFRNTNSIVNISRQVRPEIDALLEEKNVDDPHTRSVEDHIWRPVTPLSPKVLLNSYLGLSKSRLTALVALTAMAGYAMAPAPFHLDAFLMLTLGTTLTSGAANATNQIMEVPYDSQMKRTQNRVLVRGIISPLHGAYFALISGTVGVSLLGFGLNPLTAGLGAMNLILYTLIYTPMKRHSMANTWVGAFVGAVPPLMGWAACTGGLDMGAYVLAAIMYSWQFPHFNALSWNLRPEYSRAGYHMMCVLNPPLCRRVALRHCVAMIGLCTLAPVFDITTWFFAVDSLPVNLYMTYLAWKFYRQGDSKSSRELFRFSLVQIPALVILMLISKKRHSHSPEEAEKNEHISAAV